MFFQNGMKILCFLTFLGIFQAFNVTKFLSHCEKDEDFLDCSDIELSSSDSEEFIKSQFNVTNEEFIFFDGGDLGIINGHFFKQFPRAKVISFIGVYLSLRPSEEIVFNENLEMLDFQWSRIFENNNTNALHGLSNLKELHILHCYFEHPRIDHQLLLKNPNLAHLKIIDGYQRVAEKGTLKSVDENAFENLKHLEYLELVVTEITHIPDLLLISNKMLKNVTLCGQLEEFPWELPESIEYLNICSFTFKNLRRIDLKNLKIFDLIDGDLQKIDEDAFDDLDFMEELYLNEINITELNSHHLNFNKHLRFVSLSDNEQLGKHLNLSEAGLRETDDNIYENEPFEEK